jgi:hypothetical protein
MIRGVPLGPSRERALDSHDGSGPGLDPNLAAVVRQVATQVALHVLHLTVVQFNIKDGLSLNSLHFGLW